MLCPNCGTQNIDGSRFCMKCGADMANVNAQVDQGANMQQPMMNQTMPNVAPVTPDINVNAMGGIQQPIEAPINPIPNNTNVQKMSFGAYFLFIFEVIKKPITTLKNKSQELDDFKNSGILAAIAIVAAMLLNLISTMISAVCVKSLDWGSGKVKTTIEMDRLGNVNYLEVLGKSFLVYAGIIIGLAGVYYLASLVIKKSTKFQRLLGIAAVTVIPLFISVSFLTPIFSLIHFNVGAIIAILGIIYTFIIAYEGLNEELKLEGNAKVYFNGICLAVILITAYFIAYAVVQNTISSSLSF